MKGVAQVISHELTHEVHDSGELTELRIFLVSMHLGLLAVLLERKQILTYEGIRNDDAAVLLLVVFVVALLVDSLPQVDSLTDVAVLLLDAGHVVIKDSG